MTAPLSKEALHAIKAAVRLGLESLRADEPQTLSEWAAQHFILAGESSHQSAGQGRQRPQLAAGVLRAPA